MKTCRHPFLLVAVLVIFCTPVRPQSRPLIPERKGDYVHVSLPGLRFITGQALEKLQNGSTVSFVLSLSVVQGNGRKPAVLIRERFVVSFDLWEEKYSVVLGKPEGRSASRLTAAAAEAWCLDNLAIPIRSLPERQPFLMKFEGFLEESPSKPNSEHNSPLTLGKLIDVFSRKEDEKPFRCEVVAGPFRLEDLKK